MGLQIGYGMQIVTALDQATLFSSPASTVPALSPIFAVDSPNGRISKN